MKKKTSLLNISSGDLNYSNFRIIGMKKLEKHKIIILTSALALVGGITLLLHPLLHSLTIFETLVIVIVGVIMRS